MRILILLLACLAAGGAYLLGYPPPPVDPAWQVEPAEEVPEGALSVRFAGTTTLLFDDGETRWMVDGWFSRPPLWQMLFSDIAPDVDAIASGLQRMQVDALAAVIPVHSHYDHAMDSPEVARRTGAQLIGSAASANIARGWGLAEERIRVVADGEIVALGDFRITFIASRHMPYTNPDMVARLITDSEIPEPLVPPASAFDYKLGKAYVLHVEHPLGNALVVGSAGFVPGQLEGLEVDVVFLGVGGLGGQSPDYREQYWRHTVAAVQPARVIPVHWDSLTGPLDGPFTGEVRIAGLVAGGEAQTLAFLRDKAAQFPQIAFQTLPRFAPVTLFPPAAR